MACGCVYVFTAIFNFVFKGYSLLSIYLCISVAFHWLLVPERIVKSITWQNLFSTLQSVAFEYGSPAILIALVLLLPHHQFSSTATLISDDRQACFLLSFAVTH